MDWIVTSQLPNSPDNQFVIPPPPNAVLVTRMSSYFQENSRATSPSKKKRQVPETNEELVRVSNPPAGRPRLSTTHQIRQLRAQVSSMERELRDLQSKWADELPDAHTLATAQCSAREKQQVIRSEATHSELQEMVLQQQLLFAKLQTTLLRAPLYSSGQAMFESLHFDTHLSLNEDEREKALLAHNERSLTTLPSIVDRFSQMAIDKVTKSQDEGATPELPLSQIDITGCKHSTIVSSVFISEIPHTSLEEVYAAVLSYFDRIPTSMMRHFGVDAKRRRLNCEDSPVMYRRSTFNGSGLPATINNVVCSELTPSHGMVHIDAITDDPLHPVFNVGPSQYGICGMVIAPKKDTKTCITLSWLVVYHYNVLPDNPLVQKDLEMIRPILNGDLLTASVCGYIQEQRQRSPRQ